MGGAYARALRFQREGVPAVHWPPSPAARPAQGPAGSSRPAAARERYYRDLPEDIQKELWGRFFRTLEPLHAAGKLGAIHFQFALWITSGGDARQLVEHCVRVMEGTTMAVEFRNASWWNEHNRKSTLAFEREHGLVNVVVDGPQVGNSVPAVWEVTSPKLAIVRMHGRNHETWNRKGLKAASDRFNYDYNEKELGEIATHVAELAKEVPVVHAVMNNNYEDQGQRNAKTLSKLLKVAQQRA